MCFKKIPTLPDQYIATSSDEVHLMCYLLNIFFDDFPGISALSVSMLGALVLVGGLGGWAVLTAEGVPILSTPQEWVWGITPSPSSNTLVCVPFPFKFNFTYNYIISSSESQASFYLRNLNFYFKIINAILFTVFSNIF